MGHLGHAARQVSAGEGEMIWLSGFSPDTAFPALFISNSIFLLVHFSQYLPHLKGFRELERDAQAKAGCAQQSLMYGLR